VAARSCLRPRAQPPIGPCTGPPQVSPSSWQFLPGAYFTAMGQPNHRTPPAHILEMFEVQAEG
jgi:hypothetical protein